MLKDSINQLFDLYQAAFEAFDLKGVRKYYELPCQLTTPGRIITLNNDLEFKQEFSRLFDAIRDTSFIRAISDRKTYSQLNQKHLLISMNWSFLDNKENILAKFSALYSLMNINDEWKITSVVSYDFDKLVVLTAEW